MIAGYIDIILKRRQRKERFGDDGNEEEAMEEDLVTPGKNKPEHLHLKKLERLHKKTIFFLCNKMTKIFLVNIFLQVRKNTHF